MPTGFRDIDSSLPDIYAYISTGKITCRPAAASRALVYLEGSPRVTWAGQAVEVPPALDGRQTRTRHWWRGYDGC